MKNVLIVDDENEFLLSIQAGLTDYGNQFNLLTASNGREAVKQLTSTDVNLVITDLKMPEMDGLELLAYASVNFPHIPMVVMSAFATPETEENLFNMGVLKVLEKPVELEDLTNAILTGLENAAQKGSLQGISLGSFLQLLEMEEKTCLLKIKDDHRRSGSIYVWDGAPIDAKYGNKTGDDAMLEMLCFDNVQIGLEILPRGKLQKRITQGLMSLIMEAARLQDEGTKEEAESHASIPGTSKSEERMDSDTKAVAGNESNYNTNYLMEVDLMAMDKYLNDLKEIKGYKASAVMNFTGELLVSDSKDSSINLEVVGATFNDIFRSAHEASEKIGLDACTKTTIETPLGIIVMSCSGTKAKAHFHVIGILAADGNQALMKMQIDKITALVMKELG